MNIFLWFIAFGILWVISMKTTMLLADAFAPMAAWFYADGFLTTMLPWAMTLAEPARGHRVMPTKNACEAAGRGCGTEARRARSSGRRSTTSLPSPASGFFHRRFLLRLLLSVVCGLFTLGVPYAYIWGTRAVAESAQNSAVVFNHWYSPVDTSRDDIETGAEIEPGTENYESALIFLNQALFALLLAAALSKSSEHRAGCGIGASGSGSVGVGVGPRASGSATSCSSSSAPSDRPRRNWVLLAVGLVLLLPVLWPVVYVSPNVVNCVWHINCDNATWQSMWGFDSQYHGPGQTIVPVDSKTVLVRSASSSATLSAAEAAAASGGISEEDEEQVDIVFDDREDGLKTMTPEVSGSPGNDSPNDLQQLRSRPRRQCEHFARTTTHAEPGRSDATAVSLWSYETETRNEGTRLCMAQVTFSSLNVNDIDSRSQCAALCQGTWEGGRNRDEHYGCRFSMSSGAHCLLFSTDDLRMAQALHHKPTAQGGAQNKFHLTRMEVEEQQPAGTAAALHQPQLSIPPLGNGTAGRSWTVDKLERHNQFGRDLAGNVDYGFYAAFFGGYLVAGVLLFALL